MAKCTVESVFPWIPSMKWTKKQYVLRCWLKIMDSKKIWIVDLAERYFFISKLFVGRKASKTGAPSGAPSPCASLHRAIEPQGRRPKCVGPQHPPWSLRSPRSISVRWVRPRYFYQDRTTVVPGEMIGATPKCVLKQTMVDLGWFVEASKQITGCLAPINWSRISQPSTVDCGFIENQAMNHSIFVCILWYRFTFIIATFYVWYGSILSNPPTSGIELIENDWTCEMYDMSPTPLLFDDVLIVLLGIWVWLCEGRWLLAFDGICISLNIRICIYIYCTYRYSINQQWYGDVSWDARTNN